MNLKFILFMRYTLLEVLGKICRYSEYKKYWSNGRSKNLYNICSDHTHQNVNKTTILEILLICSKYESSRWGCIRFYASCVKRLKRSEIKSNFAMILEDTITSVKDQL